MLFYSICFVLLVLVSFPKASSYVEGYADMFVVRGRALDRSVEEQIQSEGRTNEVQQIFKETFEFRNIKQSLIG